MRSDDKGSTYELTLAGTAALPPFPEQPDVAAALGAGPLEVEPIDTTLPADAADLDCLNS